MARKYITSVDELPRIEYDFIIIGGGTAGCVMANRLSENPDVNVLVVEAGDSTEDNIHTAVPFLCVTLPGSDVDWKYTTVPQKGLNGRTLKFSRGLALGGSSAINFFTWNRGANDQWAKWAEVTGDEGWKWQNVEKYYKKSCKIVPPADNHNTTDQIIPSLYGSDGPVEVSIAGYPTQLDKRVENASRELGGRFRWKVDLNDGECLGIGYMPSTIGGGKRSSSATAYLAPALHRLNMTVLTGWQVTKLVSSGKSGGKEVIRAIEVGRKNEPDSKRHTLTATKEIILSAGVIGSPQILLLSGIGPAAHLQSHGIEPLVDLPAVGQHFADHPILANHYRVNSTSTFDALVRDRAKFGATLEQWIATKTGFFVDSPGNTQGYLRLPGTENGWDSKWGVDADPASGLGAGHAEMIFVDGFAAFAGSPPPTEGYYMTVLAAVSSALSEGSVSLASSDPFAQPLIDLGLYTHPFDVKAMVQTIKDAQTFLSASAWDGYVVGPVGPLAEAHTDEEKEKFARNYSATVNHPCCTVRMGTNDKNSAVNSTGEVWGVEGLRVIDASIFPFIPECHIQTHVYVIAERLGDIIKTKYDIV